MNDFWDYAIDAAQRNILFWDVLRERGNQFNAHNAEEVANVLDFEFEVVMSADTFDRPSNYLLTRVIPPKGTVIDPRKPPIVIIDPRAGHGPGIGGFKADSEVGVGFAEGHACYVIMFRQNPENGQTIEDIMKAEAAFVDHVNELHPEASGKPIMVGNCQGGWALMMLASYRPDISGPIIVAGSPLTYWEGVHGKNPMRYSGGWLGGTWLTRLTSDLGAGRFDGAWLVANFEGMNPRNTLWSKQYNLYRDVDTESDRYLQFEKYWGGYSVLNGEEMQFIVDNLFVGNTLPTGGVTTEDGVRLDYRNIRSPILCFCSWGDNITPPQQALDWILDLYSDVNDIRSHEQTIIYCIHENVGHLGIFVSGRVSKKEHAEFASNIDFINILPPGLYEAVLTKRDDSTQDGELSPTDFIASFEPRSLNDIRALGGNDSEDERRFATVQRISEINNAMYQTHAQPFVHAISTPETAKLAQDLHPSRLIYRWFSDENPWMQTIESAARGVKENRREVDRDNPFWAWQETGSKMMEEALDQYRDARDWWVETVFLQAFGNPVLQAALGVGADDDRVRPRPGTEAEHNTFVQEKISELRQRISLGGPKEAFVRSMLYVNLQGGIADERRFLALQSIVEAQGGEVEDLKQIIKEQFFMLLLDEEQSIRMLPELVKTKADRADLLAILNRLCAIGEKPEGPRAERLDKINNLLA